MKKAFKNLVQKFKKERREDEEERDKEPMRSIDKNESHRGCDYCRGYLPISDFRKCYNPRCIM
jgi:hypothetical protein